MPRPTSPRQQFAQHVVEAMHGFAPVEARGMFGGFGIFRHGLMFALIADEQLYFKADDASAPEFTAQGLAPFRYTALGKTTELRYYQAPPEVFDDAGHMVQWARKGYECALRAQGLKNDKAAARKTRKPAARDKAA